MGLLRKLTGVGMKSLSRSMVRSRMSGVEKPVINMKWIQDHGVSYVHFAGSGIELYRESPCGFMECYDLKSKKGWTSIPMVRDEMRGSTIFYCVDGYRVNSDLIIAMDSSKDFELSSHSKLGWFNLHCRADRMTKQGDESIEFSNRGVNIPEMLRILQDSLHIDSDLPAKLKYLIRFFENFKRKNRFAYLLLKKGVDYWMLLISNNPDRSNPVYNEALHLTGRDLTEVLSEAIAALGPQLNQKG